MPKFELKNYVTDHFIETGTQAGKGCASAIAAGFKRVSSIEVYPETFESAKSNLDIFQDCFGLEINLHLGDSEDILPEILKETQDRCTFWLDAHIHRSWGRSRCGKNWCPLYHELEAIRNHSRNDHIIMIDDVRLIGHKRKGARSWGTSNVNMDGVLERLQSINNKYEFIYEGGCEPNDCLVAYVK